MYTTVTRNLVSKFMSQPRKVKVFRLLILIGVLSILALQMPDTLLVMAFTPILPEYIGYKTNVHYDTPLNHDMYFKTISSCSHDYK